MVRAAAFLRIRRELRDLDPDADREAVRERLLERGRNAGFNPREMDKLRAELAKRLGRDRSCVV
jgi:hypothetical protein